MVIWPIVGDPAFIPADFLFYTVGVHLLVNPVGVGDKTFHLGLLASGLAGPLFHVLSSRSFDGDHIADWIARSLFVFTL